MYDFPDRTDDYSLKVPETTGFTCALCEEYVCVGEDIVIINDHIFHTDCKKYMTADELIEAAEIECRYKTAEREDF